VHQGKVDSFANADGLSGNVVQDVFEDREGNIWVATLDGLDRFRPYAVPTITSKQGLSNENLWSVLADSDGSVWLGGSAGLNRWKQGQLSAVGGRESTRKSNGIVNAFSGADSLFRDSSGRIWISTFSGIAYLERGRLVSVSDVPGGFVHSFAEAPSGHLWVANQNLGLFRVFERRVVERFSWPALGHKDHAFVMEADPSRNGLWLGFWQGGLVYFVNGKVEKTYSATDGLGEDRINDLRFGPRRTLWVATEGGLSRITDGHIATLSSKNGLPCDTVHWSMEDNDHAIWLYMSCGLVRIAKSELDTWADNPTRLVQATIFDASDGVRTHAFVSVYRPPVAKASDGRIWFAARDGVSIIDPHHLAFNKLPPPVHIEQVTADDKTYDVSNGMHLPTGVRHLDIDYTALSLVVPEKPRFRIKLEGQDKDWRELVNVRHVEYTNLEPRKYRFRVLACNNSGVWNEEGATLDFVIPPAWYQTTWFRSLCAAVFLALLWTLHQIRLHQQTRQFNRTLETRVGERTRIARELHDTLLQSFHGLLVRFQSVLQLLPERPLDARQRLESTIDQAAEAITEARDAVQGLRSSTVTSNELALTLKTLGEELAINTNLTSAHFRVEVLGTSRDLHPIVRDEVYRVAAEALRNAFVHAQAQLIEVELRYDHRELILTIRDDGKGIDPQVLAAGETGHYGLPGMHERAQLVGGKLEIWSEPNEGTEIQLTIPAANAYTRVAQRGWWPLNFSRKGKDKEVKIES